MPAKSITTSPNISSLDFHSEFDLPNQVLRVDLTPSVWIGSGYDNVLGVKFAISKSSGNMSLPLANPTSNTYDLEPPDMQSGEVEFDLPIAMSSVEWGIYTLTATLTDADGTQYVVTKNFDLCRPKQSGAEKNTDKGTMNVNLEMKVRDGIGYAYDNTAYSYKSASAANKAYDIKIYFDSSLELAPITSNVQPPIQFQLFTGKTTFAASNIVTFDLSDEFSVIIEYNGKVSKEVPLLDFCKVYCCYMDVLDKIVKYAGTQQEEVYSDQATKMSSYILALYMGIDCGHDISKVIENIQTIGNCDCSCDCAGAIQPVPTSTGGGMAINIFGAGNTTVSKSTVGNTVTYIVSSTSNTYALVYTGENNPPEIIITSSTSGSLTTFGVKLDMSVVADLLGTQIAGGIILSNDIADVSTGSGTAEQTLKTYTLPQVTGTNTPLLTLSQDGDEIEVMGVLITNEATIAKTFKLKVDATILATYTSTNNDDEPIFFKARINRVSLTSQFCTWEIWTGINTNTLYKGFSTLSANLGSSTHTISLTVTNASSSAGSATAKQLQIKLNKKS